jgi:hypothetical protein
VNLEDRSSRPPSCPHQVRPPAGAAVLAIPDGHPGWGPDRIVYELGRGGVDPVPCRSGVYRALVNGGCIEGPGVVAGGLTNSAGSRGGR